MPIFNPTTLTGTSDQVLVNGNTGTVEFGNVTLTLPQSIGTSSSPTFASATLSGLTQNGLLYAAAGGILSTTAAPTNGQILVGSTGNAPVLTTLSGGSNISVTNGAGSVSFSISPDPVLTGNATVTIPVGTTGQRPGSPASGNLRFNTSTNNLEVYNNNQWVYFQDSITMTDAKDPTGFAVRTDSNISFNEGTRVFSISPASTSYTVYSGGIRYIKTTTETLTITNTSGGKIICFDSSGNLVEYTSIPFNNHPMIAYIYWDAVSQKATVFSDERHGMTMDPVTHGYLHNSLGTQYRSGLTLDNFTTSGTGSLNSDATVGISGGVLFDEDLTINIVNTATPTAQWEQDLSPIGKFPIIYKLGTVWTKIPATDYPVKLVTNRIGFNQDVSGSWLITEVAANSYYTAAWIISTNDVSTPVVSVMGQAQYTTLEDAVDQAQVTSLDLTGFPFVEFKALYRLIYQTSSTYNNSIKARLVNVEDIRAVKISSVSVPMISDHGQLYGLGNDDHLQYVHISIPRTISATHTFNPSAPGAPFILGANAQGQLVTGLNADLLDGLSSSAFQPVDSDLTALANTATTGIYVRTGTGTSATRSITAGPNILVTNGNGVAGNVVVEFSGVLPTTSGGTGQTTYTDGQLLIGNTTGNTLTKSTLTAGTGISVTNGSGSITLTNTGVTSFQTSLSGLAPSTSTTGDITLAGTLGATSGGTGLSSYVVGDLLFANSPTTLARLADVATGNVLRSGGVGVAPAWGKVTLTTDVTGVLPVTNGGTNLSTTPTNGQLLIGNGTGYTLSTITAGTAISVTNGAGTISIANTGVTSAVAGTGISVSAATGAVTFTNTGVTSLIAGSGISLSASTGNVTISSISGNSGQFLAVDVTSSTITGVIPTDNTTPLVTEGTQVASLTITPVSTLAKIAGNCNIRVDSANNNKNMTMAVFRDTTLVAVSSINIATANRSQTLGVVFTDSPATTSPVTYTVRVGRSDAGTSYVNLNGGYNFGNAAGVKTAFTIQEFL